MEYNSNILIKKNKIKNKEIKQKIKNKKQFITKEINNEKTSSSPWWLNILKILGFFSLIPLTFLIPIILSTIGKMKFISLIN